MRQRLFSEASISFFLSAAAASCATGIASRLRGDMKPAAENDAATADAGASPDSAAGEGSRNDDGGEARLEAHGRWLVSAAIIFGTVVFLLPGMYFIKGQDGRFRAFMILNSVMGAAFGVGLSSFQAVTWQIMPKNAQVANSMGFNGMCRLVGIGLGNFISGLLLDFSVDSSSSTHMYTPKGYVLMCTISALITFVDVFLTKSTIRLGKEQISRARKSDAAERVVEKAEKVA
jgi:hypothetical protein